MDAEFLDAVRTSELGEADGFFRTRNQVRSLKSRIRSELAYCTRKANAEGTRHDFHLRAKTAICSLERMEALLDLPSRTNHTSTQGEISERDRFNLREVRKALRSLGPPHELLSSIFGRDCRRKTASMDAWITEALAQAKLRADKARLAETMWRVQEEITTRAESGWYIVFNTLTVRVSDKTKVFAKGSRCWREYCRNIDRAVGAHIYGSVRKGEAMRFVDPYHSYFAVVEPHKSGELHIHCVHCFRDIPDSWKRDPNAGRQTPNYRIINKLRGYWEYGFSAPISARFSEFDAWGELGHRWPVKQADSGSFEPIKAQPPIALGRYMCKYLVKEAENPKRKGDYVWRTRQSRGFGLTRLRMALDDCQQVDLMEVLKLQGTQFLQVDQIQIPNRRFRVEALRSLLKRQKNERPGNGLSGWRMSTLRKSLLAVTPRPHIVEQWRSSILRTIDYNSLNFGTSETATSIRMAASNVAAVVSRHYGGKPARFASAGAGVCHTQAPPGPRRRPSNDGSLNGPLRPLPREFARVGSERIDPGVYR